MSDQIPDNHWNLTLEHVKVIVGEVLDSFRLTLENANAGEATRLAVEVLHRDILDALIDMRRS